MADTALAIAVLSLITGTLVAPWVTFEFTKRKLKQELSQGKELILHQYQIDARKALLESIGSHKGQLIAACSELHFRLDNLYMHLSRGWPGGHSWLLTDGYYYKSFVYRVIRLIATVELLERAISYIDKSMPEADDERAFLNHVHLVKLSFTDGRLFEGMTYDSRYATAHFFVDHLSSMAEAVIKSDNGRERHVRFAELEASLNSNNEELRSALNPIFGFLRDFSSPKGDPLKWIRLVMINYATSLLLARYGYDFQMVEKPDSVLQQLELALEEGEQLDKVRANISRIEGDCLVPKSPLSVKEKAEIKAAK